MVRTVHVTGIASARTTAISLGAYLGSGRVGVITAARQVMDRSRALSIHSHWHRFSGHGIAIASAAWLSDLTLMVNAGALEGSDATPMAAFPTSAGSVHHSNLAGRVLLGGATTQAYTVDSSGRYVAAGTHPAADHIVLKPHGSAGARVELGNVLRSGDILEITVLMQNECAGIF